ncbi:MAG: DUF4340 domain-containing protein [Planctomycetes bacterium]|nr:DUF4340 domain-containing protein [Planctomycetota bacterium]
MNLARRNLVLAVLAGALAVPTFLQLQKDAETFVDLSRIPLLFDGFTADNVAHVVLARPKDEQPAVDPTKPDKRTVAYDTLALQRTDKGWVVGSMPGQQPGESAGAPVQAERVESDVFHHLRSIRKDREVLVCANATPEQLEQYGLDEGHAFVLRAQDANLQIVAELMVGKDAGAGQTGSEAVRGVYLRKSDSTDVVLYEFDKGWRRDVQVQGWFDRTLARIDTEKVTRLALRNAAGFGTTFTFAREQGKAAWVAVDAPAGLGAVRQSEVENLVQRLRWLTVTEYVKPLQRAGNLEPFGLVPPQVQVEVTYQEGDQQKLLKLTIGNKVPDKNENYVASSTSAFLMTWAASMTTPFEVDVKAQWFDPASPPSAPQAPGEKSDTGQTPPK